MGIYRLFYLVVFGACLLAKARAWGSEEMELFDLVEEMNKINKNFYEVLGVPQTAETKEIKKAFRKLSLVLHPDKNKSPDADAQFRQLVGIYEVLSDAQKRQRYHEVLEFGLPDWRSAVYYYRHVRKMGLLEMTVILFMILTVGQYIVLWAAYAEKKYTIEQNITAKSKKFQKKVKKTSNADDLELDYEEFGLEKPSVFHLLPFQTVRFVYYAITGAPQMYRLGKELWEERKRRIQEEEELANMESSEDEEPKEKKPRRRKTFKPPEATYEEEYLAEQSEGEEVKEVKPARPPPIVGGLWTDDDFVELAKFCKKFPGGIPNRWEKIADCMNRTVPEVAHMAKKIVENLSRTPVNDEEGEQQEEEEVEIVPKKVKTKGGKLKVDEGAGTDANKLWSQPQQKALENALIKFPKGTSERWVKIAKCVPEKSMDECMLRFKYLAEMVRKKKQAQEEPEQEEKPEERADDNVCVEESEQ